jgi:hypothetical protein
MITLSPISITDAKLFFEKHSSYRGEFNLAICAIEEPVQHEDVIHGVIAMVADGVEFKLGHIHTDGNAQVGSLLYGGAWRAAKALGYKRIYI